MSACPELCQKLDTESVDQAKNGLYGRRILRTRLAKNDDLKLIPEASNLGQKKMGACKNGDGNGNENKKTKIYI